MDAVQQFARVPFASTLVAGAIVCLLYLVYRLALPKPIPGIPYDETSAKSVFGSLPGLISYTKQHGMAIPWLASQNAKHNAPLIQLFLMPFGKPTVVLSDYKETQDVLLRRTKEFDRASITLGGFAGTIPDAHIAMKTGDPRFKGNKELVRDLMSPGFLQDVIAPQIYSKTLTLVELWSMKSRAAAGKPFSARQDIYDAAIDIINATAFSLGDELSVLKRQLEYYKSEKGITVHKNQDGSVEFTRLPVNETVLAMQTVIHLLSQQVSSPLPVVTYQYSMWTDPKFRRSKKIKDDLIVTQIKKSLERAERGDFSQTSATDFLVHREYSVAKKEKRDPDFFSRRAIDELFVFVVAGHETSAASLSWALKLLADHQPVQDKLRQALKASIPQASTESRQPTAMEIVQTNIPYLDAVMEECLRVGSPSPMVAREATVDTTLLGHRIPKGTSLLISSGGPSYLQKSIQVPDSVRSETARTKHWGGDWNPEDMHLFKPERWLKTDESGKLVYDSQAGPFLTFSLGPRGCFGKRLAYVELRIVFALLFWNFRFKKLDEAFSSYEKQERITVAAKSCFVELEQLFSQLS